MANAVRDFHGPYIPASGEAAARMADQYGCWYETLEDAYHYWRQVQVIAANEGNEGILEYAEYKEAQLWERMDIAERRCSVA